MAPWVDTNRTVEDRKNFIRALSSSSHRVRGPRVARMDGLQPYCNRDSTVRYAADIGSVRRRQKCCKTAELPDMPVRNVMVDAELTRRSLVR